MINLAQQLVYVRGDVQGVVNRAGSVEQYHADDEYGQRGRSQSPGFPVGFGEQRGGRRNGQYHGDKMGDRASRIFDVQFVHRNTSYMEYDVFA